MSDMMLKAVFWDMDGTLIDSEPYWHQAELDIAAENNGYWDMQLAWEGSGTPVPHVADMMIEHGCTLPADEIGKQMIERVAAAEDQRMPWVPGVQDVLISLRDAGIPSVLVTLSPKHMAQSLIAQAPEGTFAAYVCGDDPVAKKPDPEPYLFAAAKLGIDAADMPQCVAIEDSISGLMSAAASGATTISHMGCQRGGARVDGPQFADLPNYNGVTAAVLNDFVLERMAQL